MGAHERALAKGRSDNLLLLHNVGHESIYTPDRTSCQHIFINI
jgi:hypothetical protein